jgi:murein DD-endopeptidase MepM/ murein hydrolase activator NlpD
MSIAPREVIGHRALGGFLALLSAPFVALTDASAIPLNAPMLKNQTSLMPFVYPVMGPRLSSDYGVRKHPLKRVRRHHHGIDLAAPIDAPIRAIAAGRVMFADPWGGYGRLVVIQHENGLTSHYGHCNALNVQPGQTVRAGDIIGTVGNSGSSTGPHLHFEIRQKGEPTNPENILPGITSQGEG